MKLWFSFAIHPDVEEGMMPKLKDDNKLIIMTRDRTLHNFRAWKSIDPRIVFSVQTLIVWSRTSGIVKRLVRYLCIGQSPAAPGPRASRSRDGRSSCCSSSCSWTGRPWRRWSCSGRWTAWSQQAILLLRIAVSSMSVLTSRGPPTCPPSCPSWSWPLPSPGPRSARPWGSSASGARGRGAGASRRRRRSCRRRSRAGRPGRSPWKRKKWDAGQLRIKLDWLCVAVPKNTFLKLQVSSCLTSSSDEASWTVQRSCWHLRMRRKRCWKLRLKAWSGFCPTKNPNSPYVIQGPRDQEIGEFYVAQERRALKLQNCDRVGQIKDMRQYNSVTNKINVIGNAWISVRVIRILSYSISSMLKYS